MMMRGLLLQFKLFCSSQLAAVSCLYVCTCVMCTSLFNFNDTFKYSLLDYSIYAPSFLPSPIETALATTALRQWYLLSINRGDEQCMRNNINWLVRFAFRFDWRPIKIPT